MNEHLDDERRARELSPLTDSLASCIRWRLCDYEAMLRGEVELLLDPSTIAASRAHGKAETRGER